MADILGFANLPAQTPTGDSLLAIEDSSATGKATVDEVVEGSTLGAGLNGLALVKGSVANGSTLTLTLGGNTRGVVYCTSNYAAGRGEYLLSSISSGATAYVTPVLSASGLTVSASGGTVGIANAAGGAVYVSVLVFNGSVEMA